MSRTLAACGLAGVIALAGCSSAPGSAEPATTTPDPTAAESATTAAAEPDATSSTAADAEPSSAPLVGSLTAVVVDTHPHDADAFTQGLELFDGQFIEGTGLYGESSRRVIDVESGSPLITEPLDADLFGEGITIVDDEILQLTWKAGVMIRSDATTLTEIDRTSYEGEGWGLCHDGETLAMSNGSSTLTFRDPDSFAPIGSVEVSLDGAPVENLNELECVNDQIIANVWLSDLIVVIDPATGNVVATLDGSVLRPEGLPADDSSFALNGIAHDPATGRFFLTGKLWPVVYEVELS